LLAQYDYKGNIRELRNIVERLIILGNNPITATDVKTYVV
jgi:two-component system, NtrC family, nitrogen regulation response regulator NtrX